jgi:hypothetical protein
MIHAHFQTKITGQSYPKIICLCNIFGQHYLMGASRFLCTSQVVETKTTGGIGSFEALLSG